MSLLFRLSSRRPRAATATSLRPFASLGALRGSPGSPVFSVLSFFLSLALLFSFSAAAPSASAADTAPIKIGHYGSLTGKDAAFGVATGKGVQLAIAEINAKGGVLGRPLEYLVEDIQSKQGESATAVKKLISRDKVAVVIGANASANSLEAGPICQNFKIPMMAISSTNPKVTEIGDYIFRICFIDPFQGAVLAKFARTSLKAQKVALLTAVNSPYSIGLSEVLRKDFTARGGTIVAEQKYSEGEKDFRAQLTAIRPAKPDVIAITGFYTEVALMCRQARALGIDVPFIGGDGWEAPQLVELGGPAVEGTYYSTYFSAENDAPEVRSFVDRYKARWHSEVPEGVSALGYDAMYLIAAAMTKAGTTEGPKLRDAMAATKNFPGVTGNTTIDEKRNSAKAAVMLTVKNGRSVFYEAVTP